jgi:hypothetical protein
LQIRNAGDLPHCNAPPGKISTTGRGCHALQTTIGVKVVGTIWTVKLVMAADEQLISMMFPAAFHHSKVAGKRKAKGHVPFAGSGIIELFGSGNWKSNNQSSCRANQISFLLWGCRISMIFF